ncbi:bifunctional 4-hydroxy-2-oxoglutarate aldolase/2-dehydro-3-deoxy-phosphogluconate aldolase [Algibacillus agarilyticus]|uniref:bifunctional 4-hydroxy-2-oxoglutarate aldolase/2-dehydro-3-deoxy-phosphogluconate aldolase n=1 Tax=Algibacillus agarilyticus TaxID=2234133 RepID=UPI000DD00A90|nr:bifunctional 4-hydroxy-2-oxoglutarate aldolase/2-dehydro-3-deoxy-phosphogluconate aldolase [Algibacillus agarilyticus]
MKSFFSLMGEQRILPIIQADTAEQGVNIAKAMADGGLKLVEVVLRSNASIDALMAIKKELPDLCVGAGTIINADILEDALNAGSDFIITPAVTPSLLAKLAECPVPVAPGVSTTSDIALAAEFGFTEMKLFPASLAGGIPFLNAVSSVFRQVTFCPTGGITAANQGDYLALSNVKAVGGTWVADKNWVKNQEWHKITEACKAANI